MAADSRVTWGTPDVRYGAGRKVFAASTQPHIFGFCGEVVVPVQILGQLVAAVDAGTLYAEGAAADAMHQAVLDAVRRGVATAVATPTKDFTIHHVLRERDWPKTCFRAWTIVYSATTQQCASAELALPISTSVVCSLGSGARAAKAAQDRWDKSDAAGWSRAILSAFQEAISSGADGLSGGPPQMAALYTSGPAVQIGFAVGERRCVNGMEVERTTALANVEWRDDLGQTIEPVSGSLAIGARRSVLPTSLG